MTFTPWRRVYSILGDCSCEESALQANSISRRDFMKLYGAATVALSAILASEPTTLGSAQAGLPALALAGWPARTEWPLLVQTAPVTDEDAANPNSAVACELASAAPASTVILGEMGAVPACILVGAGEAVTWINTTTSDVSIRPADWSLISEDLSAVLNTVEVPAQGAATARVIHAGRIDYSAPELLQIRGTILVLGRGAA
jgi:hypothetical protein